MDTRIGKGIIQTSQEALFCFKVTFCTKWICINPLHSQLCLWFPIPGFTKVIIVQTQWYLPRTACNPGLCCIGLMATVLVLHHNNFQNCWCHAAIPWQSETLHPNKNTGPTLCCRASCDHPGFFHKLHKKRGSESCKRHNPYSNWFHGNDAGLNLRHWISFSPPLTTDTNLAGSILWLTNAQKM